MTDKVLLCAIAKQENLYIKEWVDYHLNLGFDHITIYDNNDTGGERISDAVSGDMRVDVVDFRGKTQKSCETQVEAYNHCYRNANNYTWVLFIDIDEFLWFKDYTNIKVFLSQNWVRRANVIRFHWKCYSDGEQLRYEDRPVMERFTQPCENAEVNFHTKQMYRTNLGSLRIVNVHYSTNVSYIFYPDGKPAPYTTSTKDSSVHDEVAHIKHYVTKSLEEYVRVKWARRCDGSSKTRLSMDFYFKYNKRTDEKVRYYNQLMNELKGNKGNVFVPKHTSGRNACPAELAVCPGAVNSSPKTSVITPKISPNSADVAKVDKVYPSGISVCISAWKTAEYIEECLDSVAAQTWFKDHDNYEILLGIDGCEETLAKVKEIMHKYKNLKVMMMDKNVGTYVTCNTIMKEARYEWLLRFDSDDTMPNDMVAKIFANDLNDTTIIKNKQLDCTQTAKYDYVFDGIPYTKEGKVYANEKGVISLTSWKKRINTTHLTIESLLSKCKNYHIVLVLSHSEFPRKTCDLPHSIQKYIDEKKIEIIWVEKNYKAFKKVLFTMDAYKDVPIISADDDYKYTCNYADGLYNTWLNHKQSFITYRTTDKHGFTETWGFATLHPPFAYRMFGLYYLDLIDMNTYTQDDSYYAVLRKKLKNDNIISLEKKIDDIVVPIETNVSLYEFRKKNKCVDSEILLYAKLLNVC